MLSDTARKLLRIMFNQYRDTWHYVDLNNLVRRSQRKERDVRQAMQELIDFNCIEYKNGKVRVVRTRTM